MLHTHLRSSGSWPCISLYSEAIPTWNIARCCGRGENIAHGLQTLLPEVRDLSRPLTFCCPNSEADPGLEGLEAHTVLEAHCKEKDIKLKI